MIEAFYDQNRSDLQSVLRKVFLEKYNVGPNFEYFVAGSNAKPIFKCIIKVKQDFHLAVGESTHSKNKAKEDAIKKSLKSLVPDLYKLIHLNEEKPLMKNLNLVNYTNISLSSNSISVCEENNNINKKIEDVIILDSEPESRISQSVVSSNLFMNKSDFVSDEIFFRGEFKNANFAENLNVSNEFLSRKRKKEDYVEEEPEIKMNFKRQKEKTEKKAIGAREKNEEDVFDDEDYVHGGCLKEDVYGNLAIDDPLIVDKYISCSNFTPRSVNAF